MKRLTMKRRLTLHKHTATHTHTHTVTEIKGKWDIEDSEEKKQMQISLSLSLSLSPCGLCVSHKTHPQMMTHLCLLSKLRKINTTENTNNHTHTHTHTQTRFIDLQPPLLGHIRPGCCPLSPSLFSSLSLSTPFHYHLIIRSEKGGLFIVQVCMRMCKCASARAQGILVRGALFFFVFFNCPSPCFGVSGWLSLAKMRGPDC